MSLRFPPTRPDLLSALVRLLAAVLLLVGFVVLAPAQTVLNIHSIMAFDSSTTSPYQGYSVTTTGVVIAVLSDGFYIENNSGWDSDTCTSEGTYVYTGSGSSSVLAQVAVQDSVTVTGVVAASNTSSHPGVQIDIASPVVGTNVVINSTGQTLPQTVGSSTITTSINDGSCKEFTAGSFGQWLPFEGMRVTVPSSSTMLVTQGTSGTVTGASQTATTNGQFWAVITTTTRPFRATGIDVLDPAYIASTPAVTTWNANPQLLLVDSTALGGTALDASAGTEYTGSSALVGIVDYHVSSQGYTGLLLTAASVSALSAQTGNQPVAASARQFNDQITFATLNLEQDATDVNGLTAAETNRITKLANAIVNYMQSPDILAVQATTPAALSSLVVAVSSAGGPSYTVPTASTADSNGLVNAFLVNASKFDGTPSAAQELASTTYTTTSSTTEALFDRTPLLLTAKIPRKGISDYTIYLLNTSLLSRANLASATLSEDARDRREQQVDALITLLEPMETAGEHGMVMGGLNSFEFSDGYVDTTGILDGSETASGTVWLYDSSPNTIALENTTTTAENLTAYAADSAVTVNPASSRYTYVESGSAEQPDHILITAEIAGLVAIDYARIGADFPVSATYDTSTVTRAASHDGIVAYLTVPYKTQTTVASNLNPSKYNDAVTFTATVQVIDEATGVVSTSSGTPDGSITFTDTTSGTTLCSAVAMTGGAATCTYSALSVGTHTITAAYSGSETGLGYQSSTGTLSPNQVVDQDTTTLTLISGTNPSVSGQPVTFSLTAAGAGFNGTNTPTGLVHLWDVTTASSPVELGVAQTLASGAASWTIGSLSVGTHSIDATYVGDTDDAAATSNTVAQVVTTNATTVSVVSSENPSYAGDGVTFTATAVGSYGTPTGTITFYDSTTATTLGTATLAAGTATYTASAASAAITSLAVGTHLIQANYATNGTNAAASGSVTQVVQANTTTLLLTAAPNPAYYGKSVTLTVAATGLSGTPTGTVTFQYGGAVLGVGALASGSAVFTTTSLPVGTDAIQAVYSGDGVHAAATSNTANEVILAVYNTASTLSCSPNPTEFGNTVTCTDAVAVVSGSGTPAGTVTFFDGSTSLGTATLSSGVATLATSSLAVGSHTLTAVYTENDPYLSSTSNAVTEIIASTFTLTAMPASATIYTGEATTFTLTVTPGTGFTLDVALTCTGVPANSTCTITPSTVTGGSGTAKMVIQTTAPQSTAMLHRGKGAWPLLAGLLFFLTPRRLRKRGAWMLGALLIAVLATGVLTGCGGTSTLTGGTDAGAYTVTVTGLATDGALPITASTTVTLNVKSLF